MLRKIFRALLIVGILTAGAGIDAVLFFSREALPMGFDPAQYGVAVDRAGSLLRHRRIGFDGAELCRLADFPLVRPTQRSEPETA